FRGNCREARPAADSLHHRPGRFCGHLRKVSSKRTRTAKRNRERMSMTENRPDHFGRALTCIDAGLALPDDPIVRDARIQGFESRFENARAAIQTAGRSSPYLLHPGLLGPI